MLTPSADGAYFDLFSSSCSRTCRKRVPSPIATIGPSGRPQRMGRGRRSRRSVSTVSSTAWTASNGARDSPVRPSPRTDARIESTSRSRRRAVRSRRRATGLARRRRRRRRPTAAASPEQVDVDAHDRQRRPELVGHDAHELGPRRVERGQLGQPGLDLGRQAALLDDARQQRRDRLEERDLAVGEPARVAGLDVEHADHARRATRAAPTASRSGPRCRSRGPS